MLWPKYSRRLDQLNNNALLKAWIKANRGVPTLGSPSDLYRLINAEYVRNEPIDFLEFGVFEGRTLKHWAKLNSHAASRFWGFDSFTGLPETWDFSLPKGTFDLAGRIPEIDDSRVQLIKGWFQDTLRAFLQNFQPRSRLIVHHDSDLYSSVLYCLTLMDAIAVSGTILIFDEFASALHEFRALNDYTKSYRRKLRAIGMTAPFAEQVAFIYE